jgi:hypothetical protein
MEKSRIRDKHPGSATLVTGGCLCMSRVGMLSSVEQLVACVAYNLLVPEHFLYIPCSTVFQIHRISGSRKSGPFGTAS